MRIVGIPLSHRQFGIRTSECWKGKIAAVQKKIFWTLVMVLGLIADFALPLIWGLVATVPIMLFSWWVVYRSNWFDL
jgi:hypothetical protein